MSTVKVINIQHPSAASPNIVGDANGNITFGGSAVMASSFLRNKIINGDMRIDQRNNGASITLASGVTAYGVDRMDAIATGASKFSVQRNAGSVTPPAGFSNYFGVTSLAATTVGSTDLYRIGTTIEGYSMTDLAWGTASAKNATLSFWVYSSLTGNFSVCLQNAANTRAYPILYNIPVANTWTYITIVIPGETSGAWNNDSSLGVRIQWGLGLGSTKTQTSGSWYAGDTNGATGGVNMVSTNAAVFYLTGIQFEVGSVATPFERRLIGQELALCQRYYEKSYHQSVAPGSAWSINGAQGIGSSHPTANFRFGGSFKVTKRTTTPVFTIYDSLGASGAVSYYTSSWLNGGTTFSVTPTASESGFYLGHNLTSSVETQFAWTAAAEL